MAGADLLNGGTGTPAVSQRSESGQGILGAKEGKGIVAVLSSRMSAGGYSLAHCHDNVTCLVIRQFYQRLVVYFQQNKKRRRSRKGKCHAKSMMSNEVNERLKRDTQHVPLRQNTEEKVRGKELKTV